ncbi:glycoside hydrolase family 57 protein [Nanoarchaeota archaeon]
MVNICFYFQVHQPFRLKKYRVFDIGHSHSYFDEKKNQEILRKVTNKCYYPATKVIHNLLKNHPELKISYSFSGTVLEQLEKYAPKTLSLFQKIVDTGQVEVLDETYHHSLAFLYSKKEFQDQIKLHTKKIKKLFSQKPKVFRNTELIYNNQLAKEVEKLGYKAILAEGWDHYLKWRSPNFVYQPPKTQKIKLLLKNYKLSDDIAFRFSDKHWKEHPLTAEKYANWINKINGQGEIVNLFMDYETFGEHQWADSGIFRFLSHLPKKLLQHPDNQFITPTEAAKNLKARDTLDIPHLLSWADTERDTSAWLGNKMQQSALQNIYKLQRQIKRKNNKVLTEDWRKLQTSDHFYYMCTKWFNDGDVHKYFNPYDSPYDCFIAFMNIVNDLQTRIKGKNLRGKYKPKS